MEPVKRLRYSPTPPPSPSPMRLSPPPPPPHRIVTMRGMAGGNTFNDFGYTYKPFQSHKNTGVWIGSEQHRTATRRLPPFTPPTALVETYKPPVAICHRPCRWEGRIRLDGTFENNLPDIRAVGTGPKCTKRKRAGTGNCDRSMDTAVDHHHHRQRQGKEEEEEEENESSETEDEDDDEVTADMESLIDDQVFGITMLAELAAKRKSLPLPRAKKRLRLSGF